MSKSMTDGAVLDADRFNGERCIAAAVPMIDLDLDLDVSVLEKRVFQEMVPELILGFFLPSVSQSKQIMSHSHPNIGSKRRHDHGEEDGGDQFSNVANLQTKLAQAEKAVKNFAAPLSRSTDIPTEAHTDPLVYFELEKTRQKHDNLYAPLSLAFAWR